MTAERLLHPLHSRRQLRNLRFRTNSRSLRIALSHSSPMGEEKRDVDRGSKSALPVSSGHRNQVRVLADAAVVAARWRGENRPLQAKPDYPENGRTRQAEQVRRHRVKVL
jgi:hypothetical protein